MKKRPITALSLSTAILCWSMAAHAGNSAIEAGLQNLGDVSMFYQALLNTGVINELNENQKYTIFAPVNASFVKIPPASYPCFYSQQCRPQIAALLRDHIILGHHDLHDLVTYGRGVETAGLMRIHVTQPYVQDYDVEQQRILSKTEIDGNVIYRVDGAITTPQELAQFRATNVVPVADTVTTEKTVIRKTYRNPSALPQAYPAGSMHPGSPEVSPNNASETTTIIDTYGPTTQ